MQLISLSRILVSEWSQFLIKRTAVTILASVDLEVSKVMKYGCRFLAVGAGLIIHVEVLRCRAYVLAVASQTP